MGLSYEKKCGWKYECVGDRQTDRDIKKDAKIKNAMVKQKTQKLELDVQTYS